MGRSRTTDRATPRRLPTDRTSFIGRDHEIDRLGSLIGQSRLITLTGPGGIGKTRLAIEAVRRVAPRFAGGVFLVELAEISDPERLLPTVGAALGLEDVDRASILVRLADRMAGQDTLIILDNVEHLLGAAPQVGGLLSISPTLWIVVTSRAPLHLSGEQEFPVAPLELPESGRSMSLEEVRRIESVALFADRARAVFPDFVLTEGIASTVTEICRRLDGLPLAIELAAARTKVLTPIALLDHLDRRLTGLASGPADTPARQRTLRATIAWSVDLLARGDRLAFGRLSVFTGGFTLDAAADVAADHAADPREPSRDALAVIERLVDQSLLQVDRAAEGGPRFAMLETVRELALELPTETELATLRDRHLAYFARWAEAEQAHERGPDQSAWIRRLAADRGNVRAALERARACRDGSSLLRLAGALDRRFWLASGDLDLTECRYWLDEGLAIGSPTPAVRARALHRLALTGAEPSARLASVLEASLSEYRAAGDTAAMAGVLATLGGMAVRANDLATAREQLSRGLDLAHHSEAGPQWLVDLLIPLGLLAEREGRTDVARACYGEALEQARGAGDAWGAAVSLSGLGALSFAERALESADKAFTESAELARSIGARHELLIARSGLALVRIAAGGLDTARDLIVDAARMSRGLNWWFTVHVLDSLGQWLWVAGLGSEAVTCLTAADRTRPATELSWDPERVAARARTIERGRRTLPPAVFEAASLRGTTVELMTVLNEGVTAMRAFDLRVRGRSQTHLQVALSQREVEVLALVAAGRSDGEIAERLFISRKTASSHVAHIKNKLGVESRVEIALAGIRMTQER